MPKRHWFLVVMIVVASAVAPNLSAEDPQETLALLINDASKREQLALEALDWKWINKIGHGDSWKDALQHKFNDTAPVEEYHGHWQSNRGNSLFEVKPQQAVRVLEEDVANRITTTTLGYSAFMFTPSSRLMYEGGATIIERKDHGYGDPLGPVVFPLHTGRFGMGKVYKLQMFADDPAVSLSVEPGLTDLGHEVTILSLKTGQKPSKIFPANHTTKYYFENQSHCLLQQEVWLKTHLQSKALVTETATKKIGDAFIVFPVKYVSVSWSSKYKDWRVLTIDTATLDIKQMPVEKMILQFKEPNLLVSLRPGDHHLRAKRDELSPADLDQFSKQLFEEYDKRVRK